MALYEKEWWKKLWTKKHGKKRVDVAKDIAVIKEFLLDFDDDVKIILKLLEQLNELEKEYHIANRQEVFEVNLNAQETVLEKLLERYEFLQNDVDINGLRVKRIAKEFLNRASKAGMRELVREKKKNSKWFFQW